MPRKGGGGGRSSGSTSGSSLSGRSTGTTNVSGYTRSNGTYVAGYTRSAPQSSSGSCSSGSATGTVNVSGYTRSNGTYVAGYTRSAPKSSSGSCSSGSATGTVNVSGYTQSNGTHVAGYTRSKPSASQSTVHVKSYTRADGTQVSGYTRSASTSSKTTNEKDITASTPRCYVDNAYNRKLNRVGKVIGSVVSKHSTRTPGTKDDVYVDNPYNRRLQRVGKPIPSRKSRVDRVLEDTTLDDLRSLVENLHINQHEYERNALQKLEHQQLEEKWKAMGLEPLTDVSSIWQGKVIPFKELQLEKNSIGRGGFGEVYAGLLDGTPVAFKKLHYQHLSSKRLESFTTEITVLATLSHPNTVRMFGAVVERGNIGIVMEYMHRSLFHAIFVDSDEFPESKKKEIVAETSSAANYLHNHKPMIAHCDIKSENVLLDQSNRVKLTDFGLSVMKNATESSRSSVNEATLGRGTPRYSAPEVLRGEFLQTDQFCLADIYSLSLVVFEVLVEDEPFDGLNIRQLEVNVGHGDLRPSLSASLSQPVVDLLKRSWDADPTKRPSAKEFHSIWIAISDLYVDA